MASAVAVGTCPECGGRGTLGDHCGYHIICGECRGWGHVPVVYFARRS